MKQTLPPPLCPTQKAQAPPDCPAARTPLQEAGRSVPRVSVTEPVPCPWLTRVVHPHRISYMSLHFTHGRGGSAVPILQVNRLNGGEFKSLADQDPAHEG